MGKYPALFLSILLISLSCFGCGTSPAVGIGAMATHKTTIVKDFVPVKGKKDNLLNIVYEIGKSLGYTKIERAPGLPQNIQMAQFNYRTGGARRFITGENKTEMITVLIMPEGPMEGLYITVCAAGSWGAGAEEEAKKIIDRFKEKLLERINQ